MWVLLLLLALNGFSSFTSAEQSCGISDVESFRIVNGDDATPGEIPWQVSFQFFVEDKVGDDIIEPWCGGSLIDDRWILSAAHCFSKLSLTYTEYKSTDKLRVVFGEHHLKEIERTEQIFNVKDVKIINHPKWIGGDDIINDIALVKLPSPVKLTKYVRKICLPDPKETWPKGMDCVISGWGIKRSGEIFGPRILQKAVVQLTDLTDCRGKNQSVLERIEKPNHNAGTKITNKNICTAANGKDACQGDSGGPLACRKPGQNWKIVGIASKGNFCGDTSPGIFTDVTKFRKWITKTMKSK